MGVPKFFRWISERYPCLSEVVKEYQIPEFDNLYLDMNGIIHMCSHPNDFDPHFRISEEKIFQDIFHYIEVLFRMIQPQKLFFMAVDGVAPRAKMNQQRGRRFRSAKEAEVLEQRARERGEELPSVERFDSNCITPGTEFMARLHEQLKYFVTYKVTMDRQWRKVKVILSGHETPGEGEHKIMDYIRYMKSQPGYDHNTRHCLYGLDADLIMLGLCSHEPHFSLLREEVKFGRKGKQSQRTSTPEETKFYLLHLTLMREYLELEFGVLKTLLPFPFDLEKIIDDWVLMGFLVGNDFIPPLPDMHIINGALPTLYKAYADVLPTLGGYINEGGTLNLERFKKYMEKLSAFDFEQFRDTYADLKYFQAKTGRQMRSKERHSYRNSKENGEVGLNDSSQEKSVRDADLAALIQSTEQELQMAMLALSDDDEDDDPEEWEFESDEEANENALFHLEFRQHKKDYYMNKLEYATVDSEVLRSQAEGYVRAIQWNLHYYYNGVCSWSWYYPHHYAPYISDICNFSKDMELSFDMGTPFLPFQQLLAVLPSASKKLLPVPYQQLMVEEDSPIFNFYPLDFKTDLNGKKQEWEAVVLIPFIDEEKLLEAMAPCASLLTPDEKKRNSHGPMHIYTYTVDDLGTYDAPEHFPPVKNNHALAVTATRDDIHVDRNRLVKGLCPNVRLDVFFPGFPTLKHIAYTASPQRCKVKVFEQPSQGTNMILKIVDQGKPDIKEVATQLLGEILYVGWPHLVEAKVVAVSNREFRYGLKEDTSKKSGFVIEEVKGSSSAQWELQRRGIEEHYANRMGVQIGETNILVHATVMIGRKYVFGQAGKITLEKQWCDLPSAYALQTTVRDIAVFDRTFVQFKDLQEVFPLKSVCFMLGHPHYGVMGEVVDGGATMKSGRVKVSVSVTPEPNLESVRKKYHDSNIQYMPGNMAAQRLGVSSHLISRITGTIYIIQGDKSGSMESNNKVNVGLNLKFSKRNEEIPGYSRKEGSVWQYSNKTVELVRKYMKEFPELFDYLAKNTGNDLFYDTDVFTKQDPNGTSQAEAITKWLKEQPYTLIERHACGSDILEAELVKEIEHEVDEFQKNGCRVKTVTMQVKPHLLYKSDIQIGNIAPDPSAVHKMFDRVVNVRESSTVPLGLKGTIIGIHHTDNENERMYDVLFDKPFPGGLSLNCSSNRAYRLSRPSMLNLSHGQRVEQVKTLSKPTAVVQPSGNSVVHESFTPATWNQNRSIGGAGNMHNSSAFASWNNSQSSLNGGPYVMPPHSSSIGAAQLYMALSNAGVQQQMRSSLPPQPTFPVGNRPQQTQQQQNALSSRKTKQQGYSNLVAKVSGSTANNATSSAAEYEALWAQLEQSQSSGSQQQKQSSSTNETGEDAGTEMLKKMLKISEDPCTPISPSCVSSQKGLSTRHPIKQVPVEKFEHTQVPGTNRSQENRSEYCLQLLNAFQQRGLGTPRYTYVNNMEDGSVQAQLVLPDTRAFTGEYAKTKEQASESAARIALGQLSLESSHRNSGHTSVVGNPGTVTLPIPPQKWYRQHPHQPQQQQHFPPQAFHHQQNSRQDPQSDWRRGPVPEIMTAGVPPGGRPYIRQQLQQPPPPYLFPAYQQQQQQHWRGSGAPNNANWRVNYQQQTIRPQEFWNSNTNVNTNWRQASTEEPQQQFIPLQAVKQQRNRLVGAPLQMVSQEQRQQKQQLPQQPPTQPQPSEQHQSEPHQMIPSATSQENPAAGRPNSVAAKPLVSRPRKSRLAANFSVNVNEGEK